MPRVVKADPRADLLDPLFGVRVSNAIAPRQTVGVSGTAIFGGFPEDREKDASLTGIEQFTTYSNLINNIAVIAASVRLQSNLVAKVGWNFEPADDPRGDEFAELTEEILDDMETPWHRVIKRMSGYLNLGFAISEWTAKIREDGALGFLDIAPRAQTTIERWATTRSGMVLGVTQRAPMTGEEIFLPRGKLIYIVDDSLNDDPRGLGLMRHCVDPARRLLKYEQLEGFGFETDLRGIPITRVPRLELRRRGLSDEQITTLEEPLRTFSAKHNRAADLGMTLDSETFKDDEGKPSNIRMFDVELLKSEGMGLDDQHSAIERVKREIALIWGTEAMLLGSDSAGSFALSTDKSAMLAMRIDAALREIRSVVQNDVVKPLFRINGWPMEAMPKVKTDKLMMRDIEQVTRALHDMANAGAPLLPDDKAVEQVYDQIGLAAPEREAMQTDSSLLGRNGQNAIGEEAPDDGDEGNNEGGGPEGQDPTEETEDEEQRGEARRRRRGRKDE